MKFLYKDFVKSNTYVKCKNCNYQVDCCSSCERLFREVQTVYCFIKERERGEHHLCNDCWKVEE